MVPSLCKGVVWISVHKEKKNNLGLFCEKENVSNTRNNNSKESKPITCFEGNTDVYLEFVVEHRSVVEYVLEKDKQQQRRQENWNSKQKQQRGKNTRKQLGYNNELLEDGDTNAEKSMKI